MIAGKHEVELRIAGKAEAGLMEVDDLLYS